jgi:hypothetical protein
MINVISTGVAGVNISTFINNDQPSTSNLYLRVLPRNVEILL